MNSHKKAKVVGYAIPILGSLGAVSGFTSAVLVSIIPKPRDPYYHTTQERDSVILEGKLLDIIDREHNGLSLEEYQRLYDRMELEFDPQSSPFNLRYLPPKSLEKALESLTFTQ